MAVNDIAVQEFVNAIKEPPQDTNNTYNAVVSHIDDEGVVWVYLQGSEIETPTASTSSEVEAGDSVTVQWRNNKLYIGGNYSNPSAGTATVMPSVNFVTELLEKDISANSISATTGYIGELTARNITAEDITADHATIDSLDANYAHITDGVIDNAKIGYADVNNLSTNYAQINLANVNNAWIENGVVKEAAISDAQIIGVSANKLTAGTIDASNITVTNLNASNITTGSITVDGITIDVENNEASIDGSYIENGTITMNGFAQEVKDVIDGAIETYTGTVVPTLNNTPASSWTTTKLKDQHIGDVYYVVNSASQQNGYCYRFSKSGSTYSWQLIKDSDVTAALQRLQTAEGKISNIESFDEEIATFKTETEGEISTLQTKTTSLETSLGDKVDKTVFNEVKQTVDGNSASITELSTITTNNGLTKTTNITNTVNTVSQTATGNSSKISSLTNTLGTNADGSTKSGDVMHQVSDVTQDLSGFKTTVSETYATKTRLETAETNITQNANAIKLEAATRESNLNLLIDSDAPNSGKVYAQNNRYFSDAGNTQITISNFELADPPENGLKYGRRFVCDGTNTRLRARAYAFYNSTTNDIPFIPNTTYTATWWARCTEGHGFTTVAHSKLDGTTDGTTTFEEIELTSEWQKFTRVFTTGSTPNTKYNRIWFYARFHANTAGTVEICGCKLIAGDAVEQYKTTIEQTADSIVSLASNQSTYVKPDGTTATNNIASAIKQTATSIESVVANNDTYTAPDGTTKTNIIKSAIKQNADNIELKVSKDGVIASINASVEESGGSAVKISADKVNIQGAAIFTGSGRLSETSLDNAYDAKGAASAAESNAKDYADGAVADKADKSNAVARTQRIYYRKTSSGAPSANKTWLATSGTGYGNWSLKVPQMTSGTTKYPYLYTAVQTQTVAQMAAGNACSCSAVLLDDTTTVIDGGTIITGTVNANAVNASSGTFDTANIPNLNASKITAGDISADRMKVNSISAINSNTGTVKIAASKVAIDGTAIFNAIESDVAGVAQDAVDGVEVGGRNLFGYGSDCQNSLDGLSQSTVKFSIVTEDGIKCAHISGQKNKTGHLGSSMLYTPKPLEWFTFSAWVKLKNISAGTTNYLLGTYFGGETISGSWRDVQNVSIYVDGVKKSGAQGNWAGYITDTNWHRLVITAQYQNYAYSANFRGCIYARDFTGDMYVHHIKWERGTKATDWTPAPEDVQAEIDAKKSVHTLDTRYSYTYAQILTYSVEGYSRTWTSNGALANGVKIGDTVRLKVTASDMNNTPVYVVGTVTAVTTNDVTMTSHGLDTTVIDGGHILTGTIDANRIKASVISAVNDGTGKIDADKINVGAIDIGSLGGTIGGVNLVRNSLNLSSFLEESRTGCPITIYPESASIKHVVDNTSTLGVYYIIDSPEVGAKYTLSFTGSAVSGGRYSVGGAGTSSAWYGIVPYTNVVSGKNTVTFTVPSGATNLRIYFSVNTYNTTLWISHVKLEKGSVATDWSPSPYDIEPRQKIPVDKLRLESATNVESSISDDSITMTRIGNTGMWGLYYDYPCEPNAYYTVSAKVEAKSGSGDWNISFGIRDQSVAEGVSVWSGLSRTCNYAGVGGYYISTNATKTYPTQKYIRIYFCSYVVGASWTISDITVQKGAELARSTDYITHIDNNGIRVHPSSTLQNSVVINSSGMEVFKGGTTSAYSVAKYGDSARIGKESGSHLTLSPDSMSMSDGTKDLFNLLQKTMYIYWNRNYKGRQFTNSTDRHVDSWDTNTTISTWDSITVNYKLNNTLRTKKITSISNGVLVNEEIYVHFNYSGTIITLTYGRGSSAASSDIIKLESAVVSYVTDEKLSQLHTGIYPNTTVSGALRIGNGTSDSNRRNLMLVDWSGTGKFKGDILAFCGADSSGGMSLTKAEENIDAFKYEDANGHVYIDAYRVGRIVSLLCTVRNTASIAPGANLYQLNLTNAHLPKPLGTNTSGTGMSGKNMIIGNIYYNKTVTPNRYEFVCRNGGSTAVSTGGVGFTITYICQMDEVSGEIKYMDD